MRGRTGARLPVQQGDIRGTSNNSHRINAARQPSSGTSLVYVGKLAVNTSCDDLRCHLSDVNIGDVADVVKLNSRNKTKETSFCISFNTSSELDKVFQAEIWPAGVIVRPFRHFKSSRNYRNFRGHHNSWRTNNRNQHRGPPDYRCDRYDVYGYEDHYRYDEYFHDAHDDRRWYKKNDQNGSIRHQRY